MQPIPIRTNRTPRGFTRDGGFSFIELMAVLAIVGILAAAVATTTMSRLRRTAREVETANMANIAEALRTHVRLNRSVPAVAQWPTVIARQMSVAPDQVVATPAKVARLFLLDPGARIGATNGATLPYVQGVAGALEPLNARALIVSSTDGALPEFELTSGSFAEVWNTVDGSIPSVFASYAGSTEDLRIQRVDLRELFYRVILSNLDPALAAQYSIGSPTDSATIASNDRIERWYIASSPLNLHLATGTLQARDLLRSDLSYVFENGRWTRYLNYGRQVSGSSISEMFQAFLNSGALSTASGAVTPSAVVQEFYVYLTSYAQWSQGASAFAAGTTNSVAPSLRILQDSQQRLDDFTTALLQQP